MVTRTGERAIGAVFGRVGIYAVVGLKNNYTPDYIIDPSPTNSSICDVLGQFLSSILCELGRKSSIKPPGLIYFKHIWWGGRLIENGGLFEKGGLFNLEKTMVSVLHKAQAEEGGGHAVETNPNVQLVNWNHPAPVHTQFYSRDWLTQSIIY